VQFVDRIQRFLRLLEWQPGESPQVGTSAAAAATAVASPGGAATAVPARAAPHSSAPGS